jgi:hypothetical protein
MGDVMAICRRINFVAEIYIALLPSTIDAVSKLGVNPRVSHQKKLPSTLDIPKLEYCLQLSMWSCPPSPFLEVKKRREHSACQKYM